MDKIESLEIKKKIVVPEKEIWKQEKKIWSEEDFGLLLGDLLVLQKDFKKDPDSFRGKGIETYHDMKKYFTDSGGNFFEDVNQIYQKYSKEGKPLVIRREDPIKVVNLVNEQPIELTFDPKVVAERGDKYANSALWPHGPANLTSGLANAFLEDHASVGPIVLVIGVKNNPEHMKIEEPTEKILEVGTITRHNVKIVSGKITQRDLRFIILRMPAKFFDPEDLAESEKEDLVAGKLNQVFRGFDFE